MHKIPVYWYGYQNVQWKNKTFINYGINSSFQNIFTKKLCTFLFVNNFVSYLKEDFVHFKHNSGQCESIFVQFEPQFVQHENNWLQLFEQSH